jgi:hypothetical protein
MDKFQISRDSQALYITMVAKDRLPVFRTEASSLAKLRHEEWKRKHTHSLWQQEKNVFSIFSEVVFMQKVLAACSIDVIASRWDPACRGLIHAFVHSKLPLDNYRTTPVRGLEALA